MAVEKKWVWFFFGWLLGSFIGFQMLFGKLAGGMGARANVQAG